MSDEPKFCKDCKHFIPDTMYDRCSATGALNRVTAEPGFARIHRDADDLKGYCGKDAKWFEIAPPKAIPPSKAWWEFWK